MPCLNILLVAERKAQNLAAFLVSDRQKKSILINLAHKTPPASSGVQKELTYS